MRILFSLILLLCPTLVTAQQGTATMGGLQSQVVAGTFDLSTATGAVQNLSFNFTPTACDGFGSVAGGTINTQISFWGMSDSAATQATFASGSAINIALTTAKFFSVIDSGGTNYQQAVISYSANTATLTWAKTGTPTGTFTYRVRCFR